MELTDISKRVVVYQAFEPSLGAPLSDRALQEQNSQAVPHRPSFGCVSHTLLLEPRLSRPVAALHGSIPTLGLLCSAQAGAAAIGGNEESLHRRRPIINGVYRMLVRPQQAATNRQRIAPDPRPSSGLCLFLFRCPR
jgi:hypothetical protein